MRKSPQAPFKASFLDKMGLLTKEWQQFFQIIVSILQYNSQEQNFDLVNNTAVASDVTGLKLDYQYQSAAFIEYLIQRITSTTSKIQIGILRATYNPDTNAWSIGEYGTSGPDASGVTFSITSLGQVQYTSSNLGGTEEISRIVFRIKEIRAKHSSYSRVS